MSDQPRPLSRRDYGLILVQAAVLCGLAWQFELEKSHRLHVALLFVTGGFAVHALLPESLRLPWLLGLSLGALVLMLGPVQAAYGLAVGIALIVLATLPLPFRKRVLLLVAFGGLLVWLRKDSQQLFWPVIGSMFMFRLIVYVYSIHKEGPSGGVLKTLAYFFLLPNVFFPLFPVVDYKTFCRTYGNDEPREVYQTGIHWMATGVLHLLAYRLIKYELLPAPLEIRTASQLALFLSMNYALYLRVSGQFHLICGMLHLFGFNLPRTHDHYFLASSFSEIWRRINIYWKDFLQKVCFYPVFFRLRSHGPLPALGLAIFGVFFSTWIGHSWQVYWLLGEFPLQFNEVVLWMGVGLLAAVSAASDYRRASHPERSTFTLAHAAVHALKIVGVFACISIVWAKWSLRPDMFQLLMLTGSGMEMMAHDWLMIGSVVVSFVAVAVAVQYVRSRSWWDDRPHNPVAAALDKGRLSFDASVKWHLGLMIVLVAGSLPPVYQQFGSRVARVIAGLGEERVTHGDVMALVDGYYEQLNEGALQAGPFLGDPVGPRDDRGGRYSAMTKPRQDLLGTDLIPGWTGEFDGARTTVNRWGMRDRDRSVTKPTGTYRIALVGSSIVMGYGVGDGQTFSRLLEQRLNEDASSPARRFEVLNFGMGRHFALQRRAKIAQQVLSFDPDLILYFAQQDEYYTAVEGLAGAIRAGYDLGDPCLKSLLQTLGLHQSMSEGQLTLVLNQHYEDVLSCTYQRIAALCREHVVEVAFVYLPMPNAIELPYDPRISLEIAQEAGLVTLDLSGWGKGTETSLLMRGTGDEQHPGPRGHCQIAEELFRQLTGNTRLLESARGKPSG